VRRQDAGQFRVRSIGRRLKPRDEHHLVRKIRACVAEEPEHVQRARQRVRDDAAGDDGSDRVEVVLERRGNAEVAAAAANGPEEVGVLIGACAEDPPVRHNQIGGAQVVQCEAVLGHQPSDPASERQSGYSGAANYSSRRRKTMDLGLPVELLPQDAALGADDTSPRVHVYALHRRQIDHQTVIERGVPCHIVAAATYSDAEVKRSCKFHRVDDVGDTVTARDRSRPFVDQPIVNPTPPVVTGIGGLYQLSSE
jgi:hypothetical protein